MRHAPLSSTLLAIAAPAFVGAAVAGADLELPAILSDHAVLERSAHTRVWGWATPGAAVSVTLGAAHGKATAGQDGRWTATLDLSAAPATPMDLIVDGGGHAEAKDVVVGEVWLCGGQSNMAYSLGGTLNAPAEIAQSADPSFRCFKVPEGVADAPQERGKGAWIVAGPADAGQFTAVGYYFGKALRKALGRPVGLVSAAYPATGIDSWIEAKDQDQESRGLREKYLGLPKRFAEHQKRLLAWLADNQRADHAADPAPFAGKEVDDSAWTAVSLPGAITGDGLPAAGAVWLRHAVEIGADQAGKEVTLAMDERVFGAAYWNGTKIDAITADEPVRLSVSWEKPWTIRIPAAQVLAGTNVLAIRVFAPAGNPTLRFDPHQFPLLGGGWKAKAEYALDAPSAAVAAQWPGMLPVKDFYDNFVPSACYDAMIHPLLPTTLSGVIWYQGEGDTYHPPVYRQRFPIMITAWRAAFGSELPFLFCQLPNHDNKADRPGESQWAELREAQATGLTLPHTGMAVLIDTADGDLHPLNKKDPGERLARLALADVYGKKDVASGPIFDAITVEGAKIRVKFKNQDGKLAAKDLPDTWVRRYHSPDPASAETAPLTLPSPGSAVQGFAICGADHQWQWAQAAIEHGAGGDSVVVWSDAVTAPVAVRYAWADNPTCNLYNGAGLPAAPFRSDGPEAAKKH